MHSDYSTGNQAQCAILIQLLRENWPHKGREIMELPHLLRPMPRPPVVLTIAFLVSRLAAVSAASATGAIA